ncbi:thiosulfate oxidation carrier protein SoxY [Pseudogemmobacter humi]|uniref:Sulfur oxidation protein SoxY n=1 Tax=Pseudogemmobacter humi TaxID=2483812 RepID=A0A3P5WK47_9RHOB|nr:thiosulfate oxidation carrier protein SoxY [Pseudogemmobacter humi]VDC19837.1 sulfur oxidation protein SoxY [Pseudogemmobacter humi]
MTIPRRHVLLGLATTLVPLPVLATPPEVRDRIATLFGPGPLLQGPITLDLPALAETGNSVPLTVLVESPMTGEDRITRLALFAEENPRPVVCEVAFGPRACAASLTTNIRLAATQSIVCVAQHLDGRLLTARREVRVVVGACTTLPGRY